MLGRQNSPWSQCPQLYLPRCHLLIMCRAWNLGRAPLVFLLSRLPTAVHPWVWRLVGVTRPCRTRLLWCTRLRLPHLCLCLLPRLKLLLKLYLVLLLIRMALDSSTTFVGRRYKLMGQSHTRWFGLLLLNLLLTLLLLKILFGTKLWSMSIKH
jgi:hypothetical protein